jgi:ABC-2 type transport system ATP-binding protein
MAAVLQIENLSKSYGRLLAVDKLSIEVDAGSIYGILGPNGSGKSTTLSCILGILEKDSGEFSWFGGLPAKSARKKIGALLEQPNFYPYLSASQNLRIVCRIKNLSFSEIDPVLDRVDLLARKNSKFKTYSTGMKQRLAIASCLLGNPEILVLDEPTNGLDPQGIAEIRELIVRLGDEGKTILLASHLLDEVEKVCSHVAVIKKGNLLASGVVGNVLSGDQQIVCAAKDLVQLEQALGSFPGIKKVYREHDKIILSIEGNPDATSFNKFIFEKGIVLSHLAIKKKSLEAEFLELTADKP